MPSRERPSDRGTRLGRATLARIGQELRDARLDRSLSVDSVATGLNISNAEVSRIERALAPKVPLVTLSRMAAMVGLDLSTRLYPGVTPLRDAAQIALLSSFRATLHRSLRWATEVPLPIAGDQRLGRDRLGAELALWCRGGDAPARRPGRRSTVAAQAAGRRRRWRPARCTGHSPHSRVPASGGR